MQHDPNEPDVLSHVAVPGLAIPMKDIVVIDRGESCILVYYTSLEQDNLCRIGMQIPEPEVTWLYDDLQSTFNEFITRD